MELAQRAKTEMLGLSQQQVLQCMGPPANRAASGNTSVWAYPSGGSMSSSTTIVNQGGMYPMAVTNSRFRSCVVTVNFNSGIVNQISYSGQTGGLVTGDEQCAYAVANCVGN